MITPTVEDCGIAQGHDRKRRAVDPHGAACVQESRSDYRVRLDVAWGGLLAIIGMVDLRAFGITLKIHGDKVDASETTATRCPK